MMPLLMILLIWICHNLLNENKKRVSLISVDLPTTLTTNLTSSLSPLISGPLMLLQDSSKKIILKRSRKMMPLLMMSLLIWMFLNLQNENKKRASLISHILICHNSLTKPLHLKADNWHWEHSKTKVNGTIPNQPSQTANFLNSKV